MKDETFALISILGVKDREAIEPKMVAKMGLITTLKAEREALFVDNEPPEENKSRISLLHHIIELLKLDYLYMKREQLNGMKDAFAPPITLQSINRVEQINETCIGILVKKYAAIEGVGKHGC